MRRLAHFIMQSRTQATGVVLLLTLLSLMFPLASLFAVSALALPTLRNGAREGAIIAAIALLGLVTFGGYLLGDPWNALFYGLVLWLPAWFMAVVLRESRQLSIAVMLASALGMIAVLVIYALIADPATAWQEAFAVMARPTLDRAPEPGDAEDVLSLFARFAPYLTGIVALASALSLTTSLLLARWWQAQLYHPGGFGEEFKALIMPRTLAYALIGGTLVAAGSSGGFSELAWNLVLPGLTPFVLVGFSFLHHRLGHQSFWLPGIYVLLLVVPYALVPILLLGLADTLLGLRVRMKINQN